MATLSPFLRFPCGIDVRTVTEVAYFRLGLEGGSVDKTGKRTQGHF
jgi:hypothetical protein